MKHIQLLVLFILVFGAIALPFNFPNNISPASGQELTREMANWDMINYNQYGTGHNPQSIFG